MFKFNDTTILDVLSLDSGAYALAHSEECGRRYEDAYVVRFYPNQAEPDPWADEAADYFEFADLAGALDELDSVADADRKAVEAWLRENVA